jgi:hypothetical protein
MIFFNFLNHSHIISIKEVLERNPMKDYRFLSDPSVFPLAMAYVPWQHMENVYENLEEAFKIGTIFPELNKPFTGRRPNS